MTFVDKCVLGEISEDKRYEEFHNHIEKWHLDQDTELEVHDYLGFTFLAYKMIVEDPKSLEYILKTKRNQK